MSADKTSEVCTFLQPELLTTDQLIHYLKSRFCNVQNLTSLPKDGLVRLFRQVLLPLPQRQCQANRNRKTVTTRILKSSPEGRRQETSCHPELKRQPFEGDRIKPETNTNTPNKIRITTSKRSDLDNIKINDRRKNSTEPESKTKGIHLKRSSTGDNNEKVSTETCLKKKPKTEIRWP